MALQVWLPLNGNLNNNGLNNGYTITNTGTVDASGKIGPCYSYSNTYTMLQQSPISGLGCFSVACWVYLISTTHNIFTFENDSWWQFVLYNNTLGIRDPVSGLTGTRIDKSITTIPQTTWVHLAFVYNFGTVMFYQNGVLKDTLVYHEGATMNTHDTLCIGADVKNGVNYYPGNCKINDFRVYDHCLTQQEIKEISKGLVLHYPLNSTSSTILPAGIELYDSLQSDGNCWINTKIPYDSTKDTYTVKCKFSQPSNVGQYDAVFGAYTDESHKVLRIIRGNNDSTTWAYFNGRASTLTGQVTLNSQNSNVREITMTNSTAVCTENGTTTTYNYGSRVGTDTQSIFYLFVQGDLQNNVSCLSNTILYYWTIWDANTMLGNFIPVTFYGEPGMYDTVTKKFFKNEGTGNFILGNKISIKEYEYLQCDASSYIKSGVIPTTSTNFELKYAANSLNVENVYFGCSTNVGYANGNNYSLDIYNSKLIYTFISNNSYSTGYTITANSPFIAKLWENIFSVDGITKPANRSAYHPNLEIYLFARNVNNTIHSSYPPRVGKIYYCKFWEGDELIRDFVPVSYNGVYGLFDKVELKFYSNAGAGSFTIGPSIVKYVYDCSGYNHDGKIYENLTLTTETPKYKNGVNFDGVDSSILIGNLSTMVPDGVFTFNVWFNVSEFGDRWGTIFGGPPGFEIQSRNGDGVDPLIYAYSWGGYTYPYELNKWNMLTMVRTSSGCKIYLNGVLRINGTAGSIPSGDYFLGAWRYYNYQNYKGAMCDSRIYSTALSEDDIADLYHTSALIDNKGDFYSFQLKEENENLLKYENTLLYTNPANTQTRGKYTTRNDILAMAFKATDTYFGQSSDYSKSKLLYGMFKENTQYIFDMWIDTDDVIYNGNNVTDGFVVMYTDGTGSGYNDLIVKGANPGETPKGFQHKIYISVFGKTIRSLYIYYYTSITFYVRADSYITELTNTEIYKNGITQTGQFVENTDVAFIGKADVNANEFVEI